MSDTATLTWSEANQAYLATAMDSVQDSLRAHTGSGSGEPEAMESRESDADHLWEALLSAPAALEHVCTKFGLSQFERDVLVLCAGVELDATFQSLCASALGATGQGLPTFGLALAMLPGAHWSALAPSAPLRSWRLIEVDVHEGLTSGALRIDERILHFLVGVQSMDDRLDPLVERVRHDDRLPRSHRELVDRVLTIWGRATADSSWPIIQLSTRDHSAALGIAGGVSEAANSPLYLIDSSHIPVSASERTEMIRLWEREAALSGAMLLVRCGDDDGSDTLRVAASFVERLRSPVLLLRQGPLRLETHVRVDVARPTSTEQREMWLSTLGPHVTDVRVVDEIVGQFDLSRTQIDSAGLERTADPRSLWRACRSVTRPALDHLAQRIEPSATWNDLVLPAPQREVLEDMARHVRRRAQVYDEWGFAAKSNRGLGISALFTGSSGTGKTMAAEVLGAELDLDVYRIDLSSVVSKYVGETEKNLRRVFDAAEEAGVILLFDEADALFGKRTDVKDSHDRYANIEVSYLLQRMESYRGLAILTSNMKSALDSAFLRRIRFVVNFPFPEAKSREEIWRRVWPKKTPREGLDLARLARLKVSGGNIRSISLNAAFLAADEHQPVRMNHLLKAARQECIKLERPLSSLETKDWE